MEQKHRDRAPHSIEVDDICHINGLVFVVRKVMGSGRLMVKWTGEVVDEKQDGDKDGDGSKLPAAGQ